jgi:hypothetical protein
MNLHYLRIDFDLPIFKVGDFRRAVGHKVGTEQVLFHHHDNTDKDKSKYRQEYPIIQYKELNGKASILFLGDATSEISHVLEDSWIQIGGRKRTFEVERFILNEHKLKIHQGKKLNYTYSIQDWLALNQGNYSEYNKLTGLKAKITFLEKLLGNHIMSFIKGVKWQKEHRYEVEIQDLMTHSLKTYKDTEFNAYSFNFRTNISLPNYIGLGQKSSEGYGMIQLLEK